MMLLTKNNQQIWIDWKVQWQKNKWGESWNIGVYPWNNSGSLRRTWGVSAKNCLLVAFLWGSTSLFHQSYNMEMPLYNKEHLWYYMGLSENRVYSQWNSHLIGIMIINHWVQGYTIFRQTHMGPKQYGYKKKPRHPDGTLTSLHGWVVIPSVIRKWKSWRPVEPIASLV